MMRPGRIMAGLPVAEKAPLFHAQTPLVLYSKYSLGVTPKARRNIAVKALGLS